ncbi:hypothetical protein BCR39DRAFT_560770 [Naematelia encephala]|uniref:Uncharacterized protein n=1 Tax=Naematelia encephala TaxID=71784 RepID=A0A1Y2ATZ9_9TREE|nr:hypothetical protein BCR39DRAFT_560770 [Naematelia encephala]
MAPTIPSTNMPRSSLAPSLVRRERKPTHATSATNATGLSGTTAVASGGGTTISRPSTLRSSNVLSHFETPTGRKPSSHFQTKDWLGNDARERSFRERFGEMFGLRTPSKIPPSQKSIGNPSQPQLVSSPSTSHEPSPVHPERINPRDCPLPDRRDTIFQPAK